MLKYTRPNLYGGTNIYLNRGYNQSFYTRPNINGGFNTYSYGTPNGVFSIPRSENSIYYNGGRYDSRNGNR